MLLINSANAWEDPLCSISVIYGLYLKEFHETYYCVALRQNQLSYVQDLLLSAVFDDVTRNNPIRTDKRMAYSVFSC